MELRFHFDPACPWSWGTYLWLEQIAQRSDDLAVRFGLVSLLELNKGNEMPDDIREVLSQSRRLQRVLSVLIEAERWMDVARIYSKIGSVTFESGRHLDTEAVGQVCSETCSEEARFQLDDEALDDQVVKMHQSAMALGGAGVGSPIISIEGGSHGFYGPIVDRRLDEREADTLFSIVKSAFELTSFYELKRGHAGNPSFG